MRWRILEAGPADAHDAGSWGRKQCAKCVPGWGGAFWRQDRLPLMMLGLGAASSVQNAFRDEVAHFGARTG